MSRSLGSVLTFEYLIRHHCICSCSSAGITSILRSLPCRKPLDVCTYMYFKIYNPTSVSPPRRFSCPCQSALESKEEKHEKKYLYFVIGIYISPFELTVSLGSRMRLSLIVMPHGTNCRAAVTVPNV